MSLPAAGLLSGVDEPSHVLDQGGRNVEGGVETGDDRKVERGFLSSELACAASHRRPRR